MTLEEFIKEILYDANKFMTEWKSHKGDLNWPDEMEPGEWLEHFALFLANQKEDDYEHFAREAEREEKRIFLSQFD
jgi:hypothetical protein